MKTYTAYNAIKSLVSYVLWGITVVVAGIVVTPFSLLPKRFRYDNRLYFFITSLVGRLIIQATFVPIRVQGREHLPHYPAQPSIIVMNHSSSLDIPVVEMLIGSYPHVWMSKAGYGKIPLYGWLLKRMHVLVDTTSTQVAKNALLGMYYRIKGAARHALIFPEGTRHSDGQIHQFMPGFALLAKKLNRPVIPIYIHGAHVILPKNSSLIDSSGKTVTLIIGKPIYYTDGIAMDDFVQEVHQYFVTMQKGVS